MMQGKRLLRTIRLRNLLSYGSSSNEVELQPLNVLIGPNASGKSNLIEAIGLLRATPRDMTTPIRDGGGIGEWLWKGAQNPPAVEIETAVDFLAENVPLHYRLALTMTGQKMELVDEAVEDERPRNDNDQDVLFYYRYQNGQPVLQVVHRTGTSPLGVIRSMPVKDLSPNQSILSQLKDPSQYPELTYLGNQFSNIRLYREWNLGRNAAPRLPQLPDLPEDFLLEDASNLGLVLNDLQHRGVKQVLIEKLKKFYDAIEDITTRVHGGTVQLFIHEKGLQTPVPATRLSDGTLRYLCLLTILCHPEPPSLICIEEPELGLHPDILPVVAELLMEASQRTQLIVTTHSDVLVSALSDIPECVLVCERDENGTQLRRLEPEQLKQWLEQYTLGELWRMGEIGGTRW